MSETVPLPLVLASSSPYRRELLGRLCIPFAYQPPDIDETREAHESIPQLCVRLALAKARALADSYPAHLIIGCDQSAAVSNCQLHKPGNYERAFEQLKILSGQVVTFYTSVAVINSQSGVSLSAMDATEVHVRTLRNEEIARYLEIEQPFDCAGSFKVEKMGISLFDKVVSEDPTALIGLPMIKLCGLLRQLGCALP